MLDTLVYLKHETKVWFEITTLLIPGKNDSPAEIAAMSEWIMKELGPDVPLHLTAFHPDYKMDDLAPTPPATLTRSRKIALDAGLHYVYTGNVRDPEGQSTACVGCGEVVIERDGYDITSYGLDERGCCHACGRALAGWFDATVGGWGGRRVPVRLAAA